MKLQNFKYEIFIESVQNGVISGPYLDTFHAM